MNAVNLSEQIPRIIISLIIGLAFVVFPEFFQNSIIYIISGLIVLLGFIRLVAYFLEKDKSEVKKIPFGAILSLLIGVVMLLKPEMFLEILMLLLGFILIVAGTGQIMMYLNLKKSTVVPMKLLIFPALILAAGVLSIVNPFGSAQTLIMFFGATLLFYAISELVTMAILKKK